MAEYVFGGHLPDMLLHARSLYRRRATAMLDALDRRMPEGVSWTRPAGGFFVWLSAPEDVDTRALVAPAARLGVAYVPGAPFYSDARGRHQVRLSYSRADESSIDEGVRRLATLFGGDAM
jgi:DNA-binding transcriptional MocR family regulator